MRHSRTHPLEWFLVIAAAVAHWHTIITVLAVRGSGMACAVLLRLL